MAPQRKHMAPRLVHGGEYINLETGARVAPGEPGVVVCRRLEDLPTGFALAARGGIRIARCGACGTAIAYSLKSPHADTPHICLQCAGIEPLPMGAATRPV